MPASFVFVGNTQVGSELSQSLLAAGFTAAPDVESAEVVITYCTSQQQLENVYFDSAGVIARSAEGTYLIDLSPASPAFAKEINAMSLVSNLHAIEAPLVVLNPTLVQAYARENLVAYVAGEERDIQAMSEYFDALFARTVQCGSAGKAQLSRCAATAVRASNIVGAAEACSLIQQIDSSVQDRAFASLAHVLSSEMEILISAAQSSSHTGSYTVEILNGELEATMDAADEVGLVLPQLEACEYLFRMLELIDGGHMAASAVALLYLEEAAAAKHGLDWSRAEQVYAHMDSHEHHHEHHHHGEDDHLHEEDFGYDDFGFGYSPN